MQNFNPLLDVCLNQTYRGNFFNESQLIKKKYFVCYIVQSQIVIHKPTIENTVIDEHPLDWSEERPHVKIISWREV